MDATMATGSVAGTPAVADLRRKVTGGWKKASLLVPALLFAICVAGVAVMITNGGKLAATLGFLFGLMLFFGAGPAVALHVQIAKHMSGEAEARARQVLEAFAGCELKPLDVSVTWVGKRCVGTGIGWDGHILHVLDAGEAAAVPLHMLRGWSWTIEGADTLQTFGNVSGVTKVQVAAANLNSRAEAYRRSGLFLQVADASKPVWHFNTAERTVLERWDEFLRQIVDARAAEVTRAERETAIVQAERDRIAALPAIQDIRLGMDMREAETIAQAAHGKVESVESGRRFSTTGSEEILTILGDVDGRVVSVVSEQRAVASRTAVRAALERRYGAATKDADGRLTFGTAGPQASLVADVTAIDDTAVRVAVSLRKSVTETLPDLRL